jgi:hypothetical protein
MNMIRTLQDTIEFATKMAERLPEDRDAILFKAPGIAVRDLGRLGKDIRLPPVYERLATGIGLLGISIGYFALSPACMETDLISALLDQNSSQHPVTLEARRHALLVVGQDEADLVAIGVGGSTNEDVVYRLESTRAPGVRISRIAKDFEAFMILAANLNAIKYVERLQGQTAVDEMTKRCHSLGCTDEEGRFWAMKAGL